MVGKRVLNGRKTCTYKSFLVGKRVLNGRKTCTYERCKPCYKRAAEDWKNTKYYLQITNKDFFVF